MCKPVTVEAWNNVCPSSINTVAYVRSLRKVARGSNSPDPTNVVPSFTHPSKNAMQFLQSVSHTQSSDTSIFVTLCDYMLTGHRHGYQNLLKIYWWGLKCASPSFCCIRHITCCDFGKVPFLGGFSTLLLSQIAVKCSTKSAFISLLSSSPAVASRPLDRLSPSATERVSLE